MSRTRLELLQWAGLLAAPAAWAAQYVIGYFLSQGRCELAHWRSGWEPAQITLTSLAALVAFLAETAAYIVYRDLAHTGESAAAPAGRQHFFAVAGLVGNVLFFVAIVLTGVTIVTTEACRQS